MTALTSPYLGVYDVFWLSLIHICEWENGKRADGIRYAMGRKHKDPCAG